MPSRTFTSTGIFFFAIYTFLLIHALFACTPSFRCSLNFQHIHSKFAIFSYNTLHSLQSSSVLHGVTRHNRRTLMLFTKRVKMLHKFSEAVDYPET